MRNRLKFTDTSDFDAIFGTLKNGHYEADADYRAFMFPSGKIVELFSDHTACHLMDVFKDCIGHVADFYADDEIDNAFGIEFTPAPTAVYKNINRYSHRNVISVDIDENQAMFPIKTDKDGFIHRLNTMLSRNCSIIKSDIALSMIQHYYHNIHHMYSFVRDDNQKKFIASDALVDNLNGLLELNRCVIQTFIRLAETGVNMKQLFNNFLNSKYSYLDFFIMVCGIGKVESSIRNVVTVSKLSYFHILRDLDYDVVMMPELILQDETFIERQR